MSSVKTLCFGEMLLRLRPFGKSRLFQEHSLEALFGGSEANVAASLAILGEKSAYATVLPDNEVGKACRRDLMSYGIDLTPSVTGKGRMSLYYLTNGANHLPSGVIYDREYSALSLAGPGAIDWDTAMKDCGRLHISGITPALSESAMRLTFEAARKAKEKGLTVSFDLNYRKNLWKYECNPAEILTELCGYTDLLISNDDQLRNILGISVDGDFDAMYPDSRDFERLCKAVLDRFPTMKAVALALRRTHSADHNDIAGYYADRKCFAASKRYEIKNIVDRIGGGDALTAGLIYGLDNLDTPAEAIEFAVAASCLKHSIPGDVNLATLSEVNALLKDGSGRLDR
ncbi:MAG: sugar kinase [Clostridia bacterium]|nr:sugar kinase [Clostridia bacterium]